MSRENVMDEERAGEPLSVGEEAWYRDFAKDRDTNLTVAVSRLLATLDRDRLVGSVIRDLAREALASRDSWASSGYAMAPLPTEAEVRAALAPTDEP